jgi:hypothetical protein
VQILYLESIKRLEQEINVNFKTFIRKYVIKPNIIELLMASQPIFGR